MREVEQISRVANQRLGGNKNPLFPQKLQFLKCLCNDANSQMKKGKAKKKLVQVCLKVY